MDEMYTEKTIAADPYEEPAQYEANPYGEAPQAAEPQHQQPPQYQPPQYQQPQYGQPQYGQPQYGQPQYGQPQYGQPQYGQPQYQQPQYGQPLYQQPLYQPPQYQQYPAYRQPVRGGGAAKAFAIVSFVAGCIALGIFMMIIMATTSTSHNLYRYSTERAGIAAISLIYGMLTSVPGLIFGIIAMAKKTNKFTLALLGIIFSASLLIFGCIMLMTL